MYYIWRRTMDGKEPYVHASSGGMPQNYLTTDKRKVEFVLLKTSATWDSSIVDFIEQERAKDN